MQISVTERLVVCPHCGATDNGRYCSACGGELDEKPRHAFLHMVDSVLKVGELKRYVETYVTILRSPTQNTIQLYEQGRVAEAFQFLAFSASLYALLGYWVSLDKRDNKTGRAPNRLERRPAKAAAPSLRA